MPLVKCPECSNDVSDQAEACPACGFPLNKGVIERELRLFRKRILQYCLIVCAIGLPVGIAMELPYVWGLSIAGIVIAGFKLTVMRKT
ncbi:MAG: hypothetical protein ABIP48_15080 [Planctomycetota bacterium]